MIRNFGRITVLLLVSMLIAPAVEAGSCGNEAKLRTTRVDIRVINIDLVRTMGLLGEQSKINIVLARGLNAPLKRQRLHGSLDKVLDKIAGQVGTVWWWSGNEVHMANRSDAVTRSIDFPYMKNLVEAAKRLCLPVEAIEFREAHAGGLLRVSGPGGVVREIEDLAKSLRESFGRAKFTKYGHQRYQKFD